MLLGYILLKSGLVQSVIYYTKGYPTFVSDATTRDCMNTVNILRGMTRSINLNPHQSRDVSAVPTGTHSRRLGEELSQMVAAGRIRFQHDVFWCLPIHFASMPATVRRTIECNSILFIKGDANYRRLIDDRKCPFNTPSESVFKYWPSFIGVAMCALRSCKSEVCCGVTEDAQQKARAEDSTWLVSGEWGLIQFAN